MTTSASSKNNNDPTTPHIVYILTKLELGGAQKVCLSLMQNLERSGVSVSLITGSEGVLVPEAQKFSSVFFLPSFKRDISIKGMWGEIKNFFAIIKILRGLKKQYQHIIVHTHSTKAGLIGRWAALLVGIKHRIHTVHGYGFHEYQSWARWLPIYLLELITSFITTHFVCVSGHDRRTGMRLFPRFAKKSSLIRAAVEWEKFTPACTMSNCSSTVRSNGSTSSPRAPSLNTHTNLKTDSKPFIIGTVACFKPQKNLFDLLQAFKQAHHTIVQGGGTAPGLQIIGDGILRPSIEAWIKHEQLTHAVSLLGWQHDVAGWMHQWDLFALSSLWEGLPCSVVEARLCKLPVVSYSVGGVPEVIHNNTNGFLITPKDWPGLATTITRLITDQHLYTTLRNHHDDLQDFNDIVMAKNHSLLYQKVLQASHK